MNATKSSEERTRILANLQENRTRLDSLSDRFEQSTGLAEADAQNERNTDDLTILLAAREDLERAYLYTLPKIKMSRCPLTGAIVEKTIDTLGLDGPWWNYDNPVRLEDAVPDTWLGFSGSLALTGTLPKLTFPVMPGPSVPVIYPGLLEDQDVRAVLSTVQVGGYQGVAISWFVRRDRHRFTPPNEWGAPWCDVPGETGFTMRGPSIWQLPYADTDLATWIRRGKLFWIAPDDDSLLLRADVTGCPYLGMAGDGRLQYLVDGELDYLGMTDKDIRTQSMTPEEFEAAAQLLRDEENGEDA